MLFPQEEKPSTAITIFFIFNSSNLSAKDTFILKTDRTFDIKKSEVTTKELKKLKILIKKQEETDGSANTKLTSQTDAADDLVIEENDSGQVSLEDLTTAQIYSLISDYADDMPFTISDKANIFLDEHSDLFPAVSKEAVIPFVDSTIEYRMVEKNPDNFGDKVFTLDSAYVTQITESSDEDSSLSLTELQVADYDGNSFYIFYLGNLEDIYADDIVSVYGLPIGMTSFSNQGGGTTSAVVLAGCYIEKQQ